MIIPSIKSLIAGSNRGNKRNGRKPTWHGSDTDRRTNALAIWNNTKRRRRQHNGNFNSHATWIANCLFLVLTLRSDEKSWGGGWRIFDSCTETVRQMQWQWSDAAAGDQRFYAQNQTHAITCWAEWAFLKVNGQHDNPWPWSFQRSTN